MLNVEYLSDVPNKTLKYKSRCSILEFKGRDCGIKRMGY